MELEDYKKGLLFDLFECYENYEDIIRALRSLNSENEITDNEYDYIMQNYDTLLNEWLEKKDNKQEIIDNINSDIVILNTILSHLENKQMFASDIKDLKQVIKDLKGLI